MNLFYNINIKERGEGTVKSDEGRGKWWRGDVVESEGDGGMGRDGEAGRVMEEGWGGRERDGGVIRMQGEWWSGEGRRDAGEGVVWRDGGRRSKSSLTWAHCCPCLLMAAGRCLWVVISIHGCLRPLVSISGHLCLFMGICVCLWVFLFVCVVVIWGMGLSDSPACTMDIVAHPCHCVLAWWHGIAALSLVCSGVAVCHELCEVNGGQEGWWLWAMGSAGCRGW